MNDGMNETVPYEAGTCLLDPFWLLDDPHFCGSLWQRKHQVLVQDQGTQTRQDINLSSPSLNHLLGCHCLFLHKTRRVVLAF